MPGSIQKPPDNKQKENACQPKHKKKIDISSTRLLSITGLLPELIAPTASALLNSPVHTKYVSKMLPITYFFKCM